MVRLKKEADDVPVGEEYKREFEMEKEAEMRLAALKPEVAKKIKGWTPRTSLGKAVMEGRITDIKEIFAQGLVIREPEIVDCLIPNLEQDLVLTGGMPGKGGGKMRTGIRITTRMHKSGRKRRLSALVIVGNKDGILGLGYSTGKDARTAIEKATQKAKLAVVPIRRGCGSWECACKKPHSIPFKIKGKMGSTKVTLLPAPRGLGLCASEQAKKMLRLAGIKDVWMGSRGETSTRLNFMRAIFTALANLSKIKIGPQDSECVGLVEGAIEETALSISEEPEELEAEEVKKEAEAEKAKEKKEVKEKVEKKEKKARVSEDEKAEKVEEKKEKVAEKVKEEKEKLRISEEEEEKTEKEK